MQAVSTPTTLAFLALVLVVAAVHVRFARLVAPGARGTLAAALALGVLLGGSAALASSGALAVYDTVPPRPLRFVMALLVATMALALSPYGARVATSAPPWLLVGFQAFRLPLELVLHRLHVEGALPVQMTFEGRNLDIVTGASALVVALLAARGRAPRWLLLAWNGMGLLLLANIVAVAALSVPGPTRIFLEEPANTLITRVPFVFLPALLVTSALFGHVVLFRRLARPVAAAPSSARAASAPRDRSAARESAGSVPDADHG